MGNAFLRWREPAVRLLSRAVPGDVLWFADTREPVFGLTFDDGPHPQTTPGLLDVLREHGARATFFLIGERVRAHPELVERIAAEGHELGNHLMRDERSVLAPDERFARELAETSALLSPYGEIRWFRPGAGFFTPRMLRTAAEQGLRAVLGTVVTPDKELIRPGSIVVLHEGTSNRRGVVAATDELLGAVDLRAVTVSDLLG